MQTKLLIFANQNNGFEITNYLLKRKDAKIICIIVYKEDKNQWWKSVKKLAIKFNKKYIVYKNEDELFKKIKDLKIDLIISVNWRHKISERILQLSKIGGVNFHNSLLPQYRGAYANSWPILFGENKAGFTLHWMTKNFDDGDIIYQSKVDINSWDTSEDVWKKINKLFVRKFKLIWPKLSLWSRMSKKQDGKSSYYSIRDFEKNNEIDLNQKIKVIDFINFLKAKTFSKYNNAYFVDPLSKKKVFISIKLKKDN